MTSKWQPWILHNVIYPILKGQEVNYVLIRTITQPPSNEHEYEDVCSLEADSSIQFYKEPICIFSCRADVNKHISWKICFYRGFETRLCKRAESQKQIQLHFGMKWLYSNHIWKRQFGHNIIVLMMDHISKDSRKTAKSFQIMTCKNVYAKILDAA